MVFSKRLNRENTYTGFKAKKCCFVEQQESNAVRNGQKLKTYTVSLILPYKRYQESALVKDLSIKRIVDDESLNCTQSSGKIYTATREKNIRKIFIILQF